jgi:hypothetical protein
MSYPWLMISPQINIMFKLEKPSLNCNNNKFYSVISFFFSLKGYVKFCRIKILFACAQS